MTLLGPAIIARALSQRNMKDAYGNRWQYHSRSDHHSKVACWCLLLDVLSGCPSLQRSVTAGRVGFGINHEMRDFRNDRRKNLDLVLCTPADGARPGPSFASLSTHYRIPLTAEEKRALDALPPLHRVPVGGVQLAVEAKAAMTEHVKALPRLYDELNSSHLAIHGSADHAIAAGLVLINVSATFVSPDRNRHRIGRRKATVTRHDPHKAAARTVGKLREIPRRTQPNVDGFDAMGVLLVELCNDGSPVRLWLEPPAPGPLDILNYGQMVSRVTSLYAARFAAG